MKSLTSFLKFISINAPVFIFYLYMFIFIVLIAEDEFQTLQNDFMEKYYLEFEDTEENKFCYTDIHREYVSFSE